MTIQNKIKKNRINILNIAKKHGAYNVRIFGSVARGQSDQYSDADFLVDLDKNKSLLDLGGLQMELQNLLDCEVDVVTEKGLRSRFRNKVIREAVPL